MYLLRAKDIMVSDPVTADPEAKIEDIVDKMHREDVGSVIITQGSKPINIITKGDVLVAFRSDYLGRSVRELISFLDKDKLIVVKGDALITDVIAVFDEHGIKHVPVVDEKGELMGLVSSADIIRNVPQLIFLDPLTGISNRRYLSLLEARIGGKNRRGIWILMIDIDNFKDLNDRWGHIVGDLVLREVARVISESVRSNDDVVRYGGEEFLVVLYRTDKEGATIVAEKIRKNVEGISFPNFPELRVTVSVGGAPFTGNMEEAICKADHFLYRAKEAGKNRIYVEE